MGVIRIMSVGKSGVGKSTIGNCIISGDPMGKDFETSSSANSCTQDATWAKSKDFRYCDVPGIPDTDAGNTKQFYDIIIEKAREELNVILFVFKYERIDVSVYSKAKMLFRELKKSNAIKFLVINDMNNYTCSAPATEADYKITEASITSSTGMEFSHVISMTSGNMKQSMANLKELLSQTKSHKSPSLKTYVELKAYVSELTKKKNYHETVYAEAQEEIDSIRKQLLIILEVSVISAAGLATASVGAFFTFGISLGIATSSAIAAAAASVALVIKEKELKVAESKLRSKDKINEAIKNLEVACRSFKELDDALSANT